MSTKKMYNCLFVLCTVKEKEDLHPDPEGQSIKDEIFGEYRLVYFVSLLMDFK